MIAVRMMQASAHQVIHVIAMGHRFVPARWAMLVRAARLRRALDGVGGVDRDRVLVDVIIVHMVQMPVVQVIDVAGNKAGIIPTRAVPEICHTRSHDPALRARTECSLELDDVTL
jgi:hypothetical protein